MGFPCGVPVGWPSPPPTATLCGPTGHWHLQHLLSTGHMQASGQVLGWRQKTRLQTRHGETKRGLWALGCGESSPGAVSPEQSAWAQTQGPEG